MPTVELDAVAIHYEVDGDAEAPPCVVLHGGLGLDHVAYRRTLRRLVDELGLRVVHFDQRGNGRSVPADLAALTMEQLADDVVALADHLGIGPFIVFGHSYGGFVAQELAIRHRSRVTGLLLCDTTPGQLGANESPDDTEQGPPPPPEVLAAMASIPASDEEMAAGMADLLPAYFHRPEAVDLAALGEGIVFRAGAMVRGFEVLAGWSSVDRLSSIAAPTLVCVGRHDVFTSWPQAHRIAGRMRNAEVVVFEESGHFPWIEEPDRFFSVVGEWLSTSR